MAEQSKKIRRYATRSGLEDMQLIAELETAKECLEWRVKELEGALQDAYEDIKSDQQAYGSYAGRIVELEQELVKTRAYVQSLEHNIEFAEDAAKSRIGELEEALRKIWDTRRNGKSDFGKLIEILAITESALGTPEEKGTVMGQGWACDGGLPGTSEEE